MADYCEGGRPRTMNGRQHAVFYPSEGLALSLEDFREYMRYGGGLNV